MKKCSIAYCEFPVIALGLCSRHYQAKRKYGDPETVKQKQHHGLTASERFFLYTEKSDGCWIWKGFKDPNGYGRLNVNGIPMLASRLSYQVHYGSIPEGKYVCHKCDTPSCVNPEHLFLGTQQDNVDDMISKGRDKKRALKGMAHPNSKLTDDDVRAIKASNEQTKALSRRFKISEAVIHDIRKGKIWRHIT